MRDAIGSASAWRKFSGQKSSKKFTTITISPGAKRTAAKTTGSSAKALRPRSLARRVLSAERWAKRASSSKASKTKPRSTRSTARFMEQAASWVAWKRKDKVDRRTGKILRAGRVSQQMMTEWVDRSGVELRGAGLDESPHCYKRLNEVLAEHGDSIRILHTLTPVGVAMAGANEFDPYKD